MPRLQASVLQRVRRTDTLYYYSILQSFENVESRVPIVSRFEGFHAAITPLSRPYELCTRPVVLVEGRRLLCTSFVVHFQEFGTRDSAAWAEHAGAPYAKGRGMSDQGHLLHAYCMVLTPSKTGTAGHNDTPLRIPCPKTQTDPHTPIHTRAY